MVVSDFCFVETTHTAPEPTRKQIAPYCIKHRVSLTSCTKKKKAAEIICSF